MVCLNIFNSYVLQYIIEPNQIVYYVDDVNDKLKCCTSLFGANHFDSRSKVLEMQTFIKHKYGLEFQIIQEV